MLIILLMWAIIAVCSAIVCAIFFHLLVPEENRAYQLFGKIIENPSIWLKCLISFGSIFLLLILLPIWLPAHFILRLFGRNGFIIGNKIFLGSESFKKYEPYKYRFGDLLKIRFRR